ncbi:MAG TPA: hypothetical protein VL485_17545 [Ktedonobacteraceae bacterium]|jgi:hypothetical protein|nr:hypothetical protein [Ktedonobacteraceae bacterium]
MGTYTEPVERLRHISELEPKTDIESTDYAQEYGLSRADIPELIRMATDKDFLEEGSSDLDFAATVYALEALIQFKAEEAIEPLLILFKEYHDNDWAMPALARYYSAIGPKTMPVINSLLADSTLDVYARSFAALCFETIGLEHPEARLECIQTLVATLNTEQKEHDLNGFILGHLLHLKAVEALPDVERAYQEERVDLSIVGDWDTFQVEIGVKEPGEEQKRRKALFESGEPLTAESMIEKMVQIAQEQAIRSGTTERISPSTSNYIGSKPFKTQTQKNKAKQAKAARKKNRRKK